MNIVFMGTPDFAVPSLEALISSEKYNVKAVYTQPDKPVGRKKVLTPPIVKRIALDNDLPVFQPTSFKDEQTVKDLADFQPDVIVVIAYGRILPKVVLDIPKYGCINIHGSLLPKLRGSAPIQRAVLDGEEETGVTSMFMDVGVDTGDMLIKETVKILPNETSGELFDRLAPIGAKVLLNTLEAVENGTIARTKQDEDKATHAAMLTKDEAVIDWSKSAQSVHNTVRGLNPWPVALTMFKGKKLKIFNTRLRTENGTAGSVISVNPPIVACGDGSVELLDVQLEGKNRMLSTDFFRGQRIEKGDMI